ncbi:MAG: hypothetical protein NC334_08180, partial [Bacteroides sp.]|nr:hypothetical protein [Bacteroides sp.]
LSVDFTQKSKLFDFITTSDRIDLDYEMKMVQKFDVETVTNICNKISEYYNNAEKRIKEVNESFNTKG